MIHYSCDMCGSIIKTEEELRYVVKIEIYPADDDEEENEELGSIGDDIAGFDLEDEKGEDSADDMEYKTLRFDLCSECHKRYVRDPLFVKSHRSRFLDN
ncbi:MAG: hypothetical protein A3I59_04740 [Planctomycetes bacterium RIFCSPLOWO2_02_FULL_50_16]|nr:MAG: hypothetical protein A3I59_04740 [Planctomycetes bacterium RIFCSPLOWO2_02_FULL_50_16]